MPSERQPEHVTAEEIALLIGVKPKTIRKWTSQQRIPFVRLSPRCTRYNVAACRRWMDERTIEPLTS